MNRFFIDESLEEGLVIHDPSTVHHIKKVLRLFPSQHLEGIFQGKVFLLEIVSVGDRIVLKVLEELESPAPPPVEITLFQGLPKGDKMEWILQKVTELGVSRVVPVNTRYSLMKIKSGDKLLRWEKILGGATLQSKGIRVPVLKAPVDIARLIEVYGQELDCLVVLYEKEEPGGLDRVLRDLDGFRRIGILVGPEGGLSPEDLRHLNHDRVRTVSLGPRILRTETAAVAMTAILQFALGDMGE